MLQLGSGTGSDNFSLLQLGDKADADAQKAQSRQEDLISKEFASKTRVEEHRSEKHEEAKEGKVTSKSETHSSSKSETTSNKPQQQGQQVAEGAGVKDHE